jgi:hypothetical protein
MTRLPSTVRDTVRSRADRALADLLTTLTRRVTTDLARILSSRGAGRAAIPARRPARRSAVIVEKEDYREMPSRGTAIITVTWLPPQSPPKDMVIYQWHLVSSVRMLHPALVAA